MKKEIVRKNEKIEWKEKENKNEVNKVEDEEGD